MSSKEGRRIQEWEGKRNDELKRGPEWWKAEESGRGGRKTEKRELVMMVVVVEGWRTSMFMNQSVG
jgi:hypothetical protein